MSYNSTRITARSNLPVADPDLQIRWGPGHPDPEIRGGGLKKKNIGPLGLSLVQK